MNTGRRAGAGELLGAYAIFDGELLMDTGEDARNACRQKKQSYSQSAIQLMQLCEHRNQEQELCEKDVLTDSIRKERRWPPPPCISYARFLNGKWIDQSMGV